MKRKEIEHYNFEFCNLTKQRINTDKDDYCIVIDCRGNKIMNTKFYKNEEFKEYIQGKEKKSAFDKFTNYSDKLLKNLAEKTGIDLTQEPEETKKEYVIK